MILRKGAAAVVTKNLEISYLLDFYGDVLTEKQRDVMEQYYNDDLSLSEIADNFGITRQGVRDAIKRGMALISRRGFESIACIARNRNPEQGKRHFKLLTTRGAGLRPNVCMRAQAMVHMCSLQVKTEARRQGVQHIKHNNRVDPA